MRAFVALAALFLLVGADEQPQRDVRPPWEWTLEERLDGRFARAKIRDAETAAKIASEIVGQEVIPNQPLEYEIDGRLNPELFLSYELFDTLLLGFSPNDKIRASERKLRLKSLRNMGYDDERFWSSLQSVSADYLGIRVRICTDQACVDAQCASRYAALESARRLFGREQFDRVLYLVVAPSLRKASATLDPNHRAALQRAETGCQ